MLGDHPSFGGIRYLLGAIATKKSVQCIISPNQAYFTNSPLAILIRYDGILILAYNSYVTTGSDELSDHLLSIFQTKSLLTLINDYCPELESGCLEKLFVDPNNDN